MGYLTKNEGPVNKEPTYAREACESATTKRAPDVEVAVTRLASLVNSVVAKMDSLDSALRPVLRMAGPVPSCDGGKDRPSGGCPLADELHGIATTLERALMAYDGILERIEL